MASQISTLAPSVSVDDDANPPTITVGINGKNAQANLPSLNIQYFTSPDTFQDVKDAILNIMQDTSKRAILFISDKSGWFQGVIDGNKSQTLVYGSGSTVKERASDDVPLLYNCTGSLNIANSSTSLIMNAYYYSLVDGSSFYAGYSFVLDDSPSYAYILEI